MATDKEITPQRRIEDHHPAEKIDWSQPEAPAVPLSSTAGAAKGGNTKDNGSCASPASGSVAVDLDKLEALADAATQGAWEVENDDCSEDQRPALHISSEDCAMRITAWTQAGSTEKAVQVGGPRWSLLAKQTKANIDYLEAVQPLKIRALIALARSNSPAGSTRQPDTLSLRDGVRAITKLIKDGEWADLLNQDQDVCALWDAVDGLLVRLGAASGDKEQANEESSGASMHDVVLDLREFAGNPGYSHNDYADTMRRAAGTIEALRAMLFNFERVVADSESSAASTASVAALEGLTRYRPVGLNVMRPIIEREGYVKFADVERLFAAAGSASPAAAKLPVARIKEVLEKAGISMGEPYVYSACRAIEREVLAHAGAGAEPVAYMVRREGDGHIFGTYEQPADAERVKSWSEGATVFPLYLAAQSSDDVRNAAMEVLKHRDGELPTRGWLRDNDKSRAALQRLADAVRTSTKDQDTSKGGDHA